MHLAQGIVKAHNVNKLTKAGCKFIFWVADWFALMNNKMGGDIKKIQAVGKYMIEVSVREFCARRFSTFLMRRISHRCGRRAAWI